MMWFINDFHFQILVLELLFCLRLQRRERFWLRFIPAAALYCALPVMVPGGYFFPGFVVGWFTFGFLVMFILSGLLIWFCFRMSFRQMIFYCCVAHTLQHMVHCLYRVTEQALSLPFAAAQAVQMLYMGVICLVVYRFLRNHFRDSDTADVRNVHLLIFAIVSTLIVYVLSYWTTSQEQETAGVLLFDFFTCLLIVFILLDIFRIRRAEREQLIMERLLRQEQEQHQLSRATIDVINRKCHDLKHQIAALRSMSREEQRQSIDELENAVMIYDSFPKSGNEDVDLILAEKSLLAEEERVAIRSVVDGKGLSFMRIDDLYSLLGNALDNAIEASRQEEAEARRIVTLYAAPKGGLFAIHIENPCPREPLFLDGLPVTSKPDTDYHGFGMRSIRYLCEKYHGALTTGWEDGIFSLDILFPLGGQAAK
ncbi:MAG: GHKL domain-containing protein [Clostridia bacterium]|nr:GHKL domain-containing protein [Clostridia bacterium]